MKLYLVLRYCENSGINITKALVYHKDQTILVIYSLYIIKFKRKDKTFDFREFFFFRVKHQHYLGDFYLIDFKSGLRRFSDVV